jgi:hypothetical protein
MYLPRRLDGYGTPSTGFSTPLSSFSLVTSSTFLTPILPLAHVRLVRLTPALFVYVVLTALPVFYYDCPHRTPLTHLLSYLSYLAAVPYQTSASRQPRHAQSLAFREADDASDHSLVPGLQRRGRRPRPHRPPLDVRRPHGTQRPRTVRRRFLVSSNPTLASYEGKMVMKSRMFNLGAVPRVVPLLSAYLYISSLSHT